MVKQGRGGSIIGISSISALVGGAFQTHYTPTKAGILSLMQSCACALGKYNIRCNALLPGTIKTQLNEKDLEGAGFLRRAEQGDLEDLRRITRESFAAETRFHFDLRLPSVDTERLHQCWIENCLEGKAADCVFVARIDGQVAGYITCQVDPAALPHLGQARGSIGLFAVDPEARGRGLGAGLLEGAQSWLVDQGVVRVEVGTESFNYGALHSYLRAGFRLVQSSFTLHRWADGGNNA